MNATENFHTWLTVHSFKKKQIISNSVHKRSKYFDGIDFNLLKSGSTVINLSKWTLFSINFASLSCIRLFRFHLQGQMIEASTKFCTKPKLSSKLRCNTNIYCAAPPPSHTPGIKIHHFFHICLCKNPVWFASCSKGTLENLLFVLLELFGKSTQGLLYNPHCGASAVLSEKNLLLIQRATISL